MKNILFFPFFVFVTLIGCTDKNNLQEENIGYFWTTEMENRHLLNRNDSTTWDKEQFISDLENVALIPPSHPIKTSVYPTPEYDLVGKESFGGVGMFGLIGGEGSEKKVGEKTILYNSFHVGASEVTACFVNNKDDRVFFQIIVLTDFVDTVDYSHLHKIVVSRNHPDYIGEGFIKTKNNRIDYVAFIAANQISYAIVNMRMFDLIKGRTILIAPQKDNSLRSLQIESPALSSQEIDLYTDELLKKKEVEDFFSYNGNI